MERLVDATLAELPLGCDMAVPPPPRVAPKAAHDVELQLERLRKLTKGS